MKARLLKKLLNDTRYAVSDHDGYIAIGSPLCHDLISVNKQTKQIKYALDTWRKGRKAVDESGNEELAFIWDKLSELIASGEIEDIMNGVDHIENPLPVFTIRFGKLVETTTDAYEWPNVTKEGWMMYENTCFKTKEGAIDSGIKDLGYWLDNLKERRSELAEEIQKVSDKIESILSNREALIKQREECK